MNKTTILLLWLLLISSTTLWAQQSVQPKLIKRYETGYSLHSLEDNAAYLADSAGPGGRVAARVCSKERLLIALPISAGNPFLMSTLLKVDYDFTPERILYSRSEDCLGADPAVAATEFWAIPDGAALPGSVESIKSNQVQLQTLGTEDTSRRGARNYRAAVQEIIKKLRARPKAVGIVLGYYYKTPTPIMQRRLREVRKRLQQSGLRQDRYIVRFVPWPGERSVDPPEPEPKYPSVFIVEVSKDTARR